MNMYGGLAGANKWSPGVYIGPTGLYRGSAGVYKGSGGWYTDTKLPECITLCALVWGAACQRLHMADHSGDGTGHEPNNNGKPGWWW